MPPFASITVMTYNRSSTLREALDSLLPQAAARSDVEVVISDNASTDDTPAVARDYCQRFPCLRYTRNDTNVGFDGNVVACIEKAAGQYTIFFSDDDIAPPGMVDRLLAGLYETRPIAAWINHTPFYNDDVKQVSAPTQPCIKRVFTTPEEYFLFAGLGFISSVTLLTSEARKHTGAAVHDRGTAHVDIASRVVLSTSGPYLYDCTISVLARYDIRSGYDPLRFGLINTTKVHVELFNQGLLSAAGLRWHNRKSIRLFLAHHIVNNRLKGRNIVSFGELFTLYGRDPLFYIKGLPLLLIPAPLLRWIGLPVRAIMRKWRNWKLKRGTLNPPFKHLAPPSPPAVRPS